MPVFEIERDGRRFEVEAPDQEAALRSVGQFTGSGEERSFLSDMARDFQVGVQGVGRGVADLVGTPVDLVSMIMNAGSYGAESAADLAGFDVNIPRVQTPVGGSEDIANRAGAAAESAGVDLVQPEEMNTTGRLAYNVNRYGTQAVGSGAGLTRAAASRANQSSKPRLGDAFVRPYVKSPGRTAAVDVSGGVGAGTGVTLAENIAPDSPLSTFLGALGGAVAGSGAAMPVVNARALIDTIMGQRADPQIPYKMGEQEPITTRGADAASRFLQDTATDPAQASARIGERQATARMNNEPMPTPGIASDDTGLIGAELGARQSQNELNPNLRRDFVQSDKALRDRSAENVESMRDPGADQAAGLEYAQGRPAAVAAQRDADALPYLRRAEESGATVDPQPVADVIDEMLATAKRPTVRNALTQARKMLNQPGGDELDTSVAGLYETRKAINDVIRGRGDAPTDRFAKQELIRVRNALDEQINEATPEFGEYLRRYREGSEPLDDFRDSQSVSRLMGEERDLRNVAKRILSSQDYGTDQLMREVNEVVGTDPAAQRAWRAAVADELKRRVQTTQEGSISLAQLRRTFRQHEDALSEVFSPEDMETLRRGHEMLAPLENLSQSVRAGSQTVDNSRMTDVLEAAVLTYTGNAIQTGMIMRRFRMMTNLLAKFSGLEERTLSYQMTNALNRVWFDPDLMRHMLERPLKEGTGPTWNYRLQTLLATGAGARETLDEDQPGTDQPSLEDTIMEGIGQ